jgi:hypothetical protein
MLYRIEQPVGPPREKASLSDSDQVEVLLVRLIFRNLCFVTLGLFQERVSYRALR